MESIVEILQGLSIAKWEIVVYVSLMIGYVLMGLYQSVLMTTFGFTFYWGFKNLLNALPASSGTMQSPIVIYVLSGLVIVALLNVNYLLKGLKRS